MLSNDRSIVNYGRDYILDVTGGPNQTRPGQAGAGSAVGYLPDRFAGFFLPFGACGDGGVFNMRRTTASNEGVGGSGFDLLSTVGV
jgi:hypothetical protein